MPHESLQDHLHRAIAEATNVLFFFAFVVVATVSIVIGFSFAEKGFAFTSLSHSFFEKWTLFFSASLVIRDFFWRDPVLGTFGTELLGLGNLLRFGRPGFSLLLLGRHRWPGSVGGGPFYRVERAFGWT
jgi:hypothetical protein